MESEYKSIRRSIPQFRSIDLVLTCVDIGMLAFSLKETVGCVPAGLSETHRSVGRLRATRSAADIRRLRPTRNTAAGRPSLRFFCSSSMAPTTPDGGLRRRRWRSGSFRSKIRSIGYFAFCTISGPTLAPSISPPTRSATITIAPSAQHPMEMKNPLFDGVPRVLGFGGLVCVIVCFDHQLAGDG
jgi:hypothetical protein